MSDLISRQQAIDYIKTQRGRPFIGITLEEAIIMMIEEVPSAQPERKKWEWIYDNPNTFKCSKCNKYLDIGCGNMKMNFCPNCGADMRGDKDEDR